MKILFVSAILPYPLFSGGQVRIYNLLKRLSKKHEITLCAFIREDGEKAYRKNLSFCKDVICIKRGYAWQPRYLLRALFGKYPFLLATYDHPAMKRRIYHLLSSQKFDLLHLEPFYVWPSVPHKLVPMVIAEHNIEYTVYRRYAERFSISLLRPFLSWDVGKLFGWERTVWRKAAAVTAVSASDARVITSYLSHDAYLVPNGVDPTSFPFSAPRVRAEKRALFVGNFRWLPNRQAASELIQHIWPAIIRRYPGATLTIVGRHIPKVLKMQAAKRGITVSGEVADISQSYRDSDVLLAPHAIAGGTKYKILEAMASGTPVVTTPHGAEGLLADPDEHYLEARTVAEFVAQTGKIWEDRTLASDIARRARALIEENYTWDTIAARLDTVWRNAA